MTREEVAWSISCNSCFTFHNIALLLLDTMGLLERARSQRVKHHRKRSSKSSKSEDPSLPSLKGSPPRSKRKSIFPGLSSNNGTVLTTCEAGRPRSNTAHEVFYKAKPDGPTTPQEEMTALPGALQFPPRNDSFRFPSPALINNHGKNTPPTSIAHLPSLLDNSTQTLPSAPKEDRAKPVPPHYGRSVTDPTALSSAAPRETVPTQAHTWEQKDDVQRPQLKKQKSSWKTFGGLFKSKQPRRPIPEQFYQSQPPSNDALVSSTQQSEGKVGVLDSPLPSPVEGSAKRVDSGRSLTDSSDKKDGNDLLTPKPEKKNAAKSQNFSRPNLHANETSTKGPNRTPKLDTYIPDGGFDRYSIMFEKLLEPKVPLIERRLSKRTQMEPIKSGESAMKAAKQTPSSLQRSATSPHLSRMPSLTIHVANSNRADKPKSGQQFDGPVTQRPRPPKRSNTTPTTAHLALPTFNSRTPVTAKAIPLPKRTVTATEISSPASASSLLSENSLPPTPTTATSIASSIDTTVFGSPSSSSKVPNAPLPPPPIPTRSAERPSLRNPPAGSEPFNRQIVQVSVARQVSVSKARRRVADAAEVKQPLRPRVVELGKNRKSTLVMIEGGD